MVILSLIFWETIMLFSTAITPFSVSKQCTKIPFFLSLYQHLFFFNSSHPNGCEVVSHGGFDLYFFNDYWHWASFQVLTSHLHICAGVHLIHIFKAWIFEPGSFCRLVTLDHALSNRTRRRGFLFGPHLAPGQSAPSSHQVAFSIDDISYFFLIKNFFCRFLNL